MKIHTQTFLQDQKETNCFQKKIKVWKEIFPNQRYSFEKDITLRKIFFWKRYSGKGYYFEKDVLGKDVLEKDVILNKIHCKNKVS